MAEEETEKVKGNPLIVIGDKVAPKPHLVALMQELREENKLLEPEEALKYAVCISSSDVAVALKKYQDDVKMVLIGPGMEGNGVTVARMLASKAKIVMVVDPAYNALGPDPATYKEVQKNLEELGIILVLATDANSDFFEPVVKDYVISGLAAGVDLERLTPEQRGEMIDKRLDAVNKFPSLPETQRLVSELDDLDPPKKWAEAIDPDVPTKTVILRILNSARYGFRSRVETIDQAVALASAKTIREIVTACQIRQIFQKTNERTIDQFWRHSLSVGFFAKLFCLPANPEEQNGSQKTEFARFGLDEEQTALLQEVGLWSKFKLEDTDDPFTSGLLHDVGKITMVMALEDSLELVTAVIDAEFQEHKSEGKIWARSILDIERFLMKDVDHQVIGRRLAEKWEMPDSVRQVIGFHHDVQEQSPDLIKLVALANLAASTLFPYPATEAQHPFQYSLRRSSRSSRRRPRTACRKQWSRCSARTFSRTSSTSSPGSISPPTSGRSSTSGLSSSCASWSPLRSRAPR